MITNLDPLANSNNYKVMFAEHLRIEFLFKIIPRISPEYCKMIKKILWSNSSKNIFVSYPVKFLILAVSSLECFPELY